MRIQHGLPWWAWVPFLPVLLTLLLIWRLRRNHSKRKAQMVQIHSDSIPLPPDSPYRHEPQDDDLAIIKGIGVKSEAALKIAGVRTFKKLSQTSPDRLKEILMAAGLRLPDPTTWPEKAAALAGK